MAPTNNVAEAVIAGVIGIVSLCSGVYFLWEAGSPVLIALMAPSFIAGVLASRHMFPGVRMTIARRRAGLRVEMSDSPVRWVILTALPLVVNAVLRDAEPAWRFAYPSALAIAGAVLFLDMSRRLLVLRWPPVSPYADDHGTWRTLSNSRTATESFQCDSFPVELPAGQFWRDLGLSNGSSVHLRTFAQYLGFGTGPDAVHEWPGPVLPPGAEVLGKVPVAGGAIRIVALGPDDSVVFQRQYSWDELEALGWRVELRA